MNRKNAMRRYLVGLNIIDVHHFLIAVVTNGKHIASIVQEKLKME